MCGLMRIGAAREARNLFDVALSAFYIEIHKMRCEREEKDGEGSGHRGEGAVYKSGQRDLSN